MTTEMSGQGRLPRVQRNRFSTAAAYLLVAAVLACVAPSWAGAATAPQTDVMFVFDTSGSMEPVLEEAKAEIQEVMTHLGGSLPSVEFGLAEARDYGGSEYDPEPEIVPCNLVLERTPTARSPFGRYVPVLKETEPSPPAVVIVTAPPAATVIVGRFTLPEKRASTVY